MSKRYSIFLCVLFCLFIGGFGLMHLLLPETRSMLWVLSSW